MAVHEVKAEISTHTPQGVGESLLNHIKELSEEVQFLADVLVGSIPVDIGMPLKSNLTSIYSSSGIFGNIHDNCSDGIDLVVEAKSNLSRIRNAIGK